MTSQPAGISCEGTTLLNSATLPARCNELFQPGTDVTLTAEPARTQNAIGNSFTETSVFAGWGGACAGETSTTCTVTMDEATSVTAAFDLPPAPVNLNVEVVNQTRIDPTAGWAVRSQGRVTSQPAGISCEGITMLNSATLLARCNELFQPGTDVTLTAEPARVQSIIGNYFAETSVFAGWGGACAGEESTTCTVTMDEATFVTAEFELSPAPVDLDVDISNTTGWDPSLSQPVRSSGTVTSQPTGITCEKGSFLTLFTSMTDCTEAYVIGTEVTLTAEPGRVQTNWGGSTSDTSRFVGWAGACAGETSTTCTVTMDEARSVTAAFDLTPQARLDVEVTTATGFNTDLGSASYGIQYSTGTVTSQPAGIDCEGLSVLNPFVSAAACHEVYPIGTHVTLTAEPGPVVNGWGAATTETSGFAGWGAACAGEEDNTCTVTMDEAASVTAEFDLSPAPQPLDVLVSNGYGWDPSISQTVRSSGTVTSQPAGIACEELNFSNIFTQAANCGEDYPIGTEVTLTAEPGPATSVFGTTSATSEFAGWGGACADETSTTCTVTMDAARSVTARFAVSERPELTVTVTGEQERLRVGTSHATGSLSSAPAGITCRYAANRIGVIGQSGDCVEAYATGQRVTLTADPGPVRRGGGLTGGLTGQDSYVGEWGGACAGQEGTTCTVTVDEATAVSVEFLILD